MCPSDSTIRAVSALHLELAMMRRNVWRQWNDVGWDGASIERNIRQNGTSPNMSGKEIFQRKLKVASGLLIMEGSSSSCAFHFFDSFLGVGNPFLDDGWVFVLEYSAPIASYCIIMSKQILTNSGMDS